MEDATKHVGLVNWVLYRDFRWLANTNIKEDMIQQGMIGLVKACAAYDETKGMKFSPYAVWYIKMYMRQGLRLYGKDTQVVLTKDNEVLLTQEEWALIDDKAELGPKKQLCFLLSLMSNDIPAKDLQLLKDFYGINTPKKFFKDLSPDYGLSHKKVKTKIKYLCGRIKYLSKHKYPECFDGKMYRMK